MLISWAINAILPILEQGAPVVLATVISKSGSAPCLAGSKMVILGDGTSLGSIGGGVLEAEGRKQALQVFENSVSRIFTFDLSGRDAASMSMICGGRVTVFVELIESNPVNLDVFRALRDALQGDEKCFTVSDLGGINGEIREISRCLVHQDGRLSGTFLHPQSRLTALAEYAHRSIYPALVTLERRRFMIERCYTPSTVYIFGAGHISQQLAQLTANISFQTVTLDDREEFANAKRFPTANEVIVLDSFDNCMAGLEVGPDSYVVIATRGHTHDRTVLEQALRSDAGYIGMLGSRKKMLDIRKDLLAKGFCEDQLDRIHCPIGIKIDAETAAEIAVSIVAELIQFRARKWKK